MSDKKKPKTGDIVGWAWILDGDAVWMSDTRKDAREWKKDARGPAVKHLRLAKIVLAK